MPFDISGKKYTYDTGVPESEGGELAPDAAGTPTVAVEDTTGKDLTKKTKLTLSQFLSDLTTGKEGHAGRANYYPIDRNGTYPAEFSEEVQGFPSALADSTNSTSFAPQRNADGLQTLSDDAKALTDAGFRKGARSDSKIDGNQLLKDPAKVVEAYTSQVLKRNRFTSDSPLRGDKTEAAPLRFHRGKFAFAGNLTTPDVTELSYGRLATVGASLNIRSSREVTSAEPGNDPNGALTSAATLLPSAAQLGVVRVNDAMLQVQDVIDDLTKKESNEYINIVDESWGTLNNVADPYSGIGAIGMYALALALGAGIVLLVDGLSTLLSSGKSPTRAAAKDTLGRYALGRYTLEPGGNPNAFPPIPFDLAAFFGIRGTNYPFMKALKIGTNAFFGVDDSGGAGSAIESGVKAALGSPGYYAVVARTILRSGIILVDQLKKIGGNPVDVVKQIIGLIDVIKSSKLIAALNVFAQLGDQILSQDEKIIDSRTGQPARLSTIDSYTDDSTPAVAKSRLKDSLKLAWASNRTPTLYLLPKGLDGAMLRGGGLGGFDSGLDALEEKSLTKHRVISSDEQKSGGPMIPVEEAQELERRLGAEYVPFYFKDLRTREVVSFHAFLASLSDDYTANWEDTEGFGRIDPVSVYKNTRRKIGLSFYVAATSPTDFDEMWMKINKFVTLIYPQYTAGKTLTTSPAGDYRFTQPFSQLVGASPIIRLRLGDLLRSNYSRFALARLFGHGSDGLKLDGTDIKSRDRPTAFAAKLSASKRNPAYTMRLKPGLYPYADDKGLFGGLNPIPTVPKNAQVLDLTTMSEFFDVVYLTDHSAGDGRVIVKVKMADAVRTRYPKIYEYIKDEHDNEGRPMIRYVDGFYTVPISALEPTPETMKKIMNELDPGGASDEGPQKLADFMSPKKNALVKSFRSAGGKGLAGKIDSMGFDWFDRVTWETSPGRAAPIMCKVTLAFSPIHDISPGLDHMGYNRGPIYPVGTFMKNGDDDSEGKTS